MNSALDSLKALALRNLHQLEHVIDVLSSQEEASDLAVEILESLRVMQFKALGEQVHFDVGASLEFPSADEAIPLEARTYDDGTPVWAVLEAEGCSAVWFPRYESRESVERLLADARYSSARPSLRAVGREEPR